jgi:endogenous inhibitor of DNA gyrase (YacG/DUF329 family)
LRPAREPRGNPAGARVSNLRTMADTASTPAARTVACPTCGATVVWSASSPFRPFCSERCKLIDLGAWAAERYRVPGDEPRSDGDG